MAIPQAALPEGTRVRVKQGNFPVDPSVLGRTGTVIAATEYAPQNLGIVLDGETTVRHFAPSELEVVLEPALPPEREAAKRRIVRP